MLCLQGFSSLTEWLTGERVEDRQLFREQVMATSKKDVQQFLDHVTRMSGAVDGNKSQSIAVFGASAAVEKANKHLTEQGKSALEVQPSLFVGNVALIDEDEEDD